MSWKLLFWVRFMVAKMERLGARTIPWPKSNTRWSSSVRRLTWDPGRRSAHDFHRWFAWIAYFIDVLFLSRFSLLLFGCDTPWPLRHTSSSTSAASSTCTPRWSRPLIARALESSSPLPRYFPNTPNWPPFRLTNRETLTSRRFSEQEWMNFNTDFFWSNDFLLLGFFRTSLLPHRVRPAECGNSCLRAVWRVHFRSHFPRGELAHCPTPGGVLDDWTWDLLRWTGRRHGFGGLNFSLFLRVEFQLVLPCRYRQ